jgi:NAD(P)-dependent dehydrogenase (short-subunit alcohol dehydrogenase family)
MTSAREVLVLTGASAGVGRATVRELARPGVALALIARGREGLEAARAEAESRGARALAIPADVADAAALEDAARLTEERLGPIDGWINNAMVTVLAPIHETDADDFRRVTEVTYLGAVYGTMAALRRMLPRNRGTIVQVGSALSYRGIPLQAAYCGAKFALRGFTDALRSELLHDGKEIHVTMVQLPALNTPQFSWCRTVMPREPQPVPPIFQPEVAARAIVEALRARRREIWVVGSTVKAVLGSRFVSGFLDRYLARKAYDGQQTDEPLHEPRPDNLYRPVPGDHGAHGAFDARSHEHSLQSRLWRRVERAVGVLRNGPS